MSDQNRTMATRTGPSLIVRAVAGLGLLIVGTASAAWLMHASIDSETDRAIAGLAAPSVRGPLAEVRSWSPNADSDADLIVVDLARLASADPSALPAALDGLKRRPDGRLREVVVRVSLARLPKDASGEERLAEFWTSDWQSGLVGSSGALVDRIAAAGYDGLYIADGDAYGAARGTHASAEDDFVGLISRVAARAKAINPDFAIVLANGEELYTHPAVRSAVDALARENLLFGGDEPGAANPRSAVVASLHFLSRARRDGRPVLIAERLEPGPERDEARKFMIQQGFIGSFRGLSKPVSAGTR